MSNVCPVWIGYLLASPVRRLFQNPDSILGPHLKKGMTVMDVGCAMGFFSLPAAKMVGESGRVYCVDCQEEMLQQLEKRAAKAGVDRHITTRTCAPDDLGVADLAEQVDFAMAIAMVHETDSPHTLLRQISGTIRAGGKLLYAEPLGHVSMDEVLRTQSVLLDMDFKIVISQKTRKLYSAVYQKNNPANSEGIASTVTEKRSECSLRLSKECLTDVSRSGK